MPTHFVAFQITNEGVLNELGLVLEAFKLESPNNFADSVVSPNKSHVSLFVLSVDPHCEQAAAEVFRSVVSRHRHEFRARPVELSLQRVKHMSISGGHQLLYVDVEPSSGPKSLIPSLVHDLKQALSQVEGVTLDVNRSSFLHTTLINTKIGGLGPRKIPESLYDDFTDRSFGVQKVESVQLLAMRKEARRDGYYYCESEVRLN